MGDPWEQSTDKMPAIEARKRTDTAMHSAKAATAGLVVRLGSSRWVIPTAGLLTLLGAVITGVWNLAQARVEAYEGRVAAIEAAVVKAETSAHDHAAEYDLRFQRLDAANRSNELLLAEIRSQLVRIDARVAEVQVTLMRRGDR